MPVGPADGGAAFSSDENIFGSLLAYPSVWTPSANAYENRSLKVANCLVAQGSLTIAAIMESMGCKNPTRGAAMTISKTMPTNETATSLAYVFGALFVAALLALALVLFVYVPKLRNEIRNDGKMNYLTDNETGHGTGLEVSSDNDTTHGV